MTFPHVGGEEALKPWLVQLRSVIGDALGGLVDCKRGFLGFRHSLAFDHHGGKVAFGGQAGRALLSLPGEACATVPDWPAFAAWLRDELGARITRWDGAVDVFDGRPGLDDAVAWYRADGFTTGGNRPSCRQEGNWLTPDTRGRTLYVGRRKNGKLLRVYEKGKQLGQADSPWVRFELELHNRDRIVPFDVLLTPGPFVAGAYPCLRWISSEAFRVRTLQEQRRISYESLVHWAQQAYGPLVNVMGQVEGDPSAVLDRLRRPGVPSRLDLPEVPEGEGLRR
ncbi:MAG: replication initiation factor domain-containing protein [Burkholderiaceae bacterium]|nr:replication initiation factor domain-containing protein [Burkholderiaceae bacterium]